MSIELPDLFTVRRQLNSARTFVDQVNQMIGEYARLMPGNLRHVDTYTLQKLKRELKDFDALRGRWKDV